MVLVYDSSCREGRVRNDRPPHGVRPGGDQARCVSVRPLRAHGCAQTSRGMQGEPNPRLCSAPALTPRCLCRVRWRRLAAGTAAVFSMIWCRSRVWHSAAVSLSARSATARASHICSASCKGTKDLSAQAAAKEGAGCMHVAIVCDFVTEMID